MTRFYGSVGYGISKEIRPGVWDEEIVEQQYYGDVTRDAVNMKDNEQVSPDVLLGNAFSIVADAFAYNHVSEIRYITYAGVLWKVQSVEIKAPRLNIRVSGVYNGSTT